MWVHLGQTLVLELLGTRWNRCDRGHTEFWTFPLRPQQAAVTAVAAGFLWSFWLRMCVGVTVKRVNLGASRTASRAIESRFFQIHLAYMIH